MVDDKQTTEDTKNALLGNIVICGLAIIALAMLELVAMCKGVNGRGFGIACMGIVAIMLAFTGKNIKDVWSR